MSTITTLNNGDSGATFRGNINTNFSNLNTDKAETSALTSGLAGKQATLVSGTNIKTVNGNTLLGSGDLVISASANIPVQDEGSTITSTVSSFNFVGSGVTATNVGNDVTVTITSGGGSGDVVGPASSTDSVPVLFNGATGKLVKNSTPTGTGNPVLQTSPTLTTPRFADLGFIADQNGNEMLAFNSNASAVNYMELENSATGTAVHMRAKGDDASIGLHLVAKGSSGYVNVTDSVDETKRLRFDPSTNTTGVITTLRTNSTTARTIDLPNATDTLVGRATTDTLTNKRIQKRVVSTTQSATPTINTDNGDIFQITGLAQAITSFTTNLTGTPVNGEMICIQITDNGTARAITWGASFEASTVALPTTTVISTRLDVLFTWNTATSKWRILASA